jgi:hypothetical protein
MTHLISIAIKNQQNDFLRSSLVIYNPRVINVDKSPTFPPVLSELQLEK